MYTDITTKTWCGTMPPLDVIHLHTREAVLTMPCVTRQLPPPHCHQHVHTQHKAKSLRSARSRLHLFRKHFPGVSGYQMLLLLLRM